jgi:hypothetical protein
MTMVTMATTNMATENWSTNARSDYSANFSTVIVAHNHLASHSIPRNAKWCEISGWNFWR